MSVVTGKPVYLGGSRGRVEATGRGPCSSAASSRPARRQSRRCAVAVQGFGNVGSIAARLSPRRERIIAVSDIQGGIHGSKGLDMQAVAARCERAGRWPDSPGTDKISNEQLLELECDILIPAANENQIKGSNAPGSRRR